MRDEIKEMKSDNKKSFEQHIEVSKENSELTEQLVTLSKELKNIQETLAKMKLQSLSNKYVAQSATPPPPPPPSPAWLAQAEMNSGMQNSILAQDSSNGFKPMMADQPKISKFDALKSRIHITAEDLKKVTLKKTPQNNKNKVINCHILVMHIPDSKKRF